MDNLTTTSVFRPRLTTAGSEDGRNLFVKETKQKPSANKGVTRRRYSWLATTTQAETCLKQFDNTTISYPVRLVLGARQECDDASPVGPVARAAAIGNVAVVAVHVEVPVVGVPHDRVPEVSFRGNA